MTQRNALMMDPWAWREITAPDRLSGIAASARPLRDSAMPERASETPPSSVANALYWSQVPEMAIKNMPESIANFALAMAQPVLHPIDTSARIFNTGYGAASKLHGALGGEQDPEQKARDEAVLNELIAYQKNRYGGQEALKRTLATDPFGALADTSLVLGGTGAILSRAPGRVGELGKTMVAKGRDLNPIGPGKPARVTIEDTMKAAVPFDISKALDRAYSYRIANALRAAGISVPVEEPKAE